jgi:universal stress protein A
MYLSGAVEYLRTGDVETKMKFAALLRRKNEPFETKVMLPLSRILCPSDFSEPSRQAAKIAVELAEDFGAQLCLVNVVPIRPLLPHQAGFPFAVSEHEKLLQAHADEKLRQLAGEITAEGVSVRTILGRGDAADEIVRIAQQQNADIIVIATHGMTGWRRVVFGSVAEKVVRLATTPVLTTRATEA